MTPAGWFWFAVIICIWSSLTFFFGAMWASQQPGPDEDEDDAQVAYLHDWVEGHRWDR